MTPQEQALAVWREERVGYEAAARRVVRELGEAGQMLPSPLFEAKLEELKEYLRYNYTYEEEDNFREVYVQSIAGRANLSAMELANRLVEDIGGTPKFWQRKITDVATYVQYHPELAVWEANAFHERFLGLEPEAAAQLRRRKALAKKYLASLTAICRLIDRAKPQEEELVKIDECFLKVKRSEEEYCAFVEEVSGRGCTQGVSERGLLNAKKNLFLFLKPKEQRLNTLINYNFKCRKSNHSLPSKLLPKQDYANFDAILHYLRTQRRSQRINASRTTSNPPEQFAPPPVADLRQQFLANAKKPQKVSPQSAAGQPVYIWSKQFFFSYCGHVLKSDATFDYASPFERYPNINYEIDSEEEYDEFYAEDLDLNDSDESNSLDDNQNSFVVSDCHDSDREEEQRLRAITDHYFQERWVKRGEELDKYTLIGFETGPLPLLPLDEDLWCEELVGKASGKSRAEIVSLFEEQKRPISRNKLDQFLRNNFKRIRSKDKRVIYVRPEEARVDGERTEEGRSEDRDRREFPSDNESTNENYEISISYATRPRRTQDNDETIVEEEEDCRSKSKSKSRTNKRKACLEPPEGAA